MSRTACLGLRRLEFDAVRLGLLQCLANLSDLLSEIDPIPAQRQYLSESHTRKQRNHGGYV